jgi:hypothetical protein
MASGLRFAPLRRVMKSELIYCMVLVMGAIGCGGRNGARNAAAQQQYETVQEGSADGVTSTLHGPGETLPPITDTNVDTTTNFALNPTYPPPMTSASSLPPPPRPVMPQPQPTQTAEPEPAPAPAPAPDTDTAETTTTAEEPEPEPATDTTTTEAPPPPGNAGVPAG